MMMEQRRALTFTFKDTRMENPLKIPKTCLSPELEKLQNRVSWTAFSDCKRSHEHLPPKNGVDGSRSAKMKLEMMKREPLLVLTDVLKTKLGRDYMERIKRGQSWSSRRSVTQSRRASAQADLPSITSNTSTSTRTDRNDRNRRCRSETLPSHPRAASTPTKTPPSHVKRKNVRLRKEEGAKREEENDADSEEVEPGTNIQDEEDFAEVVDCELLVSCEPSEDPKSCKEFTQSRITRQWTESENDAKHSLGSEMSQQKRKRKDSASLCNGTMSHKRHRESVLRLSGEERRDAGPQNVSSEQSEENLDPCIVQFTVGGDDHTEVALSLLNSNSEADDAECSQEDATKDSEPIVLSSDEEETRCSGQAVKLGESVIRGVSPRQPKHQQTPEPEMVKEDVPPSAADPPLPDSDYSTLQVSFSTLYCGGHRGNANGDILIKDQEIFIPLTDNSGDQKVMISLGDKDLRKYSVWEQSELELEQVCFEGEDELYPVVLLLFVSESAAAALQRDLYRLQAKEDGALIRGKASPFILLTLTEPLEGVKGALLRSVLDIKCLDASAHEDAFDVMDKCNTLEDLLCPTLSLDESLALIQRIGRDCHLLSMLGMESTDSDKDTSLSAEVQLQEDPQEESHEEQQKEAEKTETIEPSVTETTAEPETKSTFQTSEDQKEEEPLPSEKQKEEPRPVYTLAHRRLKNSYSVSLCQPDSHWMKYKHQGLPRRLIQFPPPPLKGGITVTMEDLQCLDNGQFLNDVIIDFYLKYLLQKTSAAMAERSHIFSSFFYKQLTRRDNASEGGNSEACQRQRRHQRVKTWTRHVDIFKKDFLFVPVNQEAHWYLVVICFPGLDEPMVEEVGGEKCDRETGASLQGEEEETQGCTNRTDAAESPPAPTHSDGADTQSEKAKEESTKDSIPGPVDCTELTCQRMTVCKRPCILIMDSLKLSLHERVFKLLREYLQSEWEVRRGSQREFGADQMKSSHCRVPLQDNSSDCGLYLLQYVECFLKDPVAHFELPLSLEKWFPRQQVRRKREEIRDLILYIYRHQNLEKRHNEPLLY